MGGMLGFLDTIIAVYARLQLRQKSNLLIKYQKISKIGHFGRPKKGRLIQIIQEETRSLAYLMIQRRTEVNYHFLMGLNGFSDSRI